MPEFIAGQQSVYSQPIKLVVQWPFVEQKVTVL